VSDHATTISPFNTQWSPTTGYLFRPYLIAIAFIAIMTLSAYGLYGGEIGRSEQNFFLKYLLASQSAIAWMNALFMIAAVVYIVHLVVRNPFAGKVATFTTWSAVIFGFTGLLVRWQETYLINPEWGHAPVSNLYEVFILLSVITGLIYLYLERRYQVRTLGAFVLPLIVGAVLFDLWLASNNGSMIKPLVPALQSYWMKIHVPANFVGYGAFMVACGAGMMFLLRERAESKGNPNAFSVKYFPTLDQLDELNYKAILIGLPTFTLAIILGAAWANEAWGGYWSWDPKETWSLIVWLVYAGFLHARISKGWRGLPMAWWSVAGFLVTLFCFVGVNMFLAGMHSYGRLT